MPSRRLDLHLGFLKRELYYSQRRLSLHIYFARHTTVQFFQMQ